MLNKLSLPTSAMRGLTSRVGVFLRDEKGAITADFVMVAAVLAGLGATVLSNVQDGAGEAASGIQDQFQTETIVLASAPSDGGSSSSGGSSNNSDNPWYDDGSSGGGTDDGDPFLEDPVDDGTTGGDDGTTGGTDDGTTGGDDGTTGGTDDGTAGGDGSSGGDDTVEEEETASNDPPDGCWYNGSGQLKCNGKK